MSEAQPDKNRNNKRSNYEDKWRGYLQNTHDRMLQTLKGDLNEDDVILDASGGTGLLVHRLLERELPFKKYVLNDLSPRMLETAKERLPDDSRLEYTSYAAEELPFEENQFTKVICLNALHKYKEPSSAIRRFKEVLKPNGTLYLLDWNGTGWFGVLNRIIKWFDSETLHRFSLKEAKQLLRDHRYRIMEIDQWGYWYWRFYLISAGFQYWKNR